jgi:hypothetical protein
MAHEPGPHATTASATTSTKPHQPTMTHAAKEKFIGGVKETVGTVFFAEGLKEKGREQLRAGDAEALVAGSGKKHYDPALARKGIGIQHKHLGPNPKKYTEGPCAGCRDGTCRIGRDYDAALVHSVTQGHCACTGHPFVPGCKYCSRQQKQPTPLVAHKQPATKHSPPKSSVKEAMLGGPCPHCNIGHGGSHPTTSAEAVPTTTTATAPHATATTSAEEHDKGLMQKIKDIGHHHPLPHPHLPQHHKEQQPKHHEEYIELKPLQGNASSSPKTITDLEAKRVVPSSAQTHTTTTTSQQPVTTGNTVPVTTRPV